MESSTSIHQDTFYHKVRFFSRDYLRYCRYILSPEAPEAGHRFTKRLFANFIGSSRVLEDFLDYHGAKNNKNWFFYRELSASVRHISMGSYCQRHILTRLAFYDIGDISRFETDGKRMLDFLTDCLRDLAPAILDEAKRLNIEIPECHYTADHFPSTTTNERLEHDIDACERREHQRSYLVKIASEFLNIAKQFNRHAFHEPYSPERIRELVTEGVNEVEVRRYEMLVHNLQSSFDTYVIHGGFEMREQKLLKLRSHFSVVFHLLQMMGKLLHFYERHLHDASYKNIHRQVQHRLAELIDPDQLLDRTVNYGLYYVCHFLASGTDVAREVLNENIERSSVRVGIPVPRGFHSRPSLLVAKIVQHYGGKVDLCAGDSRFDAGSVLDIQWAGGKILNENITQVVFEGDARSLEDLKILASANYGEDTMGNDIPLPRELSYLRE